MCLQNTVIYSPRWNWDGDRIVPETIVPSGRTAASGVTIPANLKNRPCFRFRGALPHDNEIAVDEFPKKMAKRDYKIQKLYDPPAYARQFNYRYNTARNHVLKVFSELVAMTLPTPHVDETRASDHSRLAEPQQCTKLWLTAFLQT